MNKIKGIIVLVLMCLFMLPIAQGECYTTLKYKDVPMSFGTIKLPGDMYILEVDVKSFVERMKTDENFKKELLSFLNSKENSSFKEFFGTEIDKLLENTELLERVTFYQVGLDDGQSYRTAFLMTIAEDRQKVRDAEKAFFEGELTKEKKAVIINAYDNAKSKIENLIAQKEDSLFNTEKITKLNIESLIEKKIVQLDVQMQWSDVTFTKVNNYNAYQQDFRMAGNFVGYFVAFAGKNYIFSTDKNLGGLFLLTLDNEREFWQEIFDASFTRKIK